MKASELIRDLKTILKANGGFDPEIRLVGNKLDQGIDQVAQCFDYIYILSDNVPYVPCSYCKMESDRLCGCDK